MINIYLNREYMKNKINTSLKQSNIESNYYILQNELMKKILESFEYEQNILLNENLKINDIINKYNINDITNDNNKEKYDKFLDEILNKFEEKQIQYINNKTKEDEFLRNINYYNVLYKLKLIKIEKNQKSYYNDIEIINNKIKFFLNDLFQIKIEEEAKIIFNNKKSLWK